VAIVYSPMEALAGAVEHSEKKVIFLGVGFETTAPTVAAVLKAAHEDGRTNYFVYSGHKLVPPALRALVSDPELRLDGFLCPGHVSTIIGAKPYEFIPREYGLPCVIAGFEALDILEAVWMLAHQVAEHNPAVAIQYTRAVRSEGNPRALALMDAVFEPVDSLWRGLGLISQSGLAIREAFAAFDAERQIPTDVEETVDHPECLCGLILRGVRVPTDCSLFRKSCTPEHPVGACMVSTEGACAAYFRYESG